MGRHDGALGLVLGLAVLAPLVASDVVSGEQLTGTYALAPVVTSMSARLAPTALVAAAATGAAAAGGVWHGNVGSRDWALRLVVCGAISALAVATVQIRVRREEQLGRMTVIAETAQRAVLRALPSAIGGIGIAARYVSAAAEALVGGDLYEVAETPYGVRVVVGDVRGKGLDAVQLAATVLGAFRQAAYAEPELAQVAVRLDAVVSAVSGDEDFVTALLAEFRASGEVVLVNCGHHAPLLVRPSAAVDLVDTGTPVPPLGLGPDPAPARVRWTFGERLLFYTDGLVEARDREGRFFPVQRAGRAVAGQSLDAALDRLLAELQAHTGSRLRDDLALVLTERRPA